MSTEKTSGSLINIDLRKMDKKTLAIFGLLLTGASGGGGAYMFREQFGGWFFRPAMDAYAAEIIPTRDKRQDSATDAKLEKHLEPVKADLVYIKRLLENMPQGKAAAKKLKQDDEDRIFVPAVPYDRSSMKADHPRRTF